MIVRYVIGAALAGAVLAGCSSTSPGPSSSSAPVGGQSTHASTSAVHWWTSSDYCGMLRDTVRAGHSILPGAKAGDPQLLTATKAFVASVTAAAPSGIRAQWNVLGPTVVQLVESGGKLTAMSGVDSRLVAQAATAISADAKARCHVNISS